LQINRIFKAFSSTTIKYTAYYLFSFKELSETFRNQTFTFNRAKIIFQECQILKLKYAIM